MEQNAKKRVWPKVVLSAALVVGSLFLLQRLLVPKYVDDIIEAQETRQRVIAAFEMLFTKREDYPSKKHGTV